MPERLTEVPPPAASNGGGILEIGRTGTNGHLYQFNNRILYRLSQNISLPYLFQYISKWLTSLFGCLFPRVSLSPLFSMCVCTYLPIHPSTHTHTGTAPPCFFFSSLSFHALCDKLSFGAAGDGDGARSTLLTKKGQPFGRLRIFQFGTFWECTTFFRKCKALVETLIGRDTCIAWRLRGCCCRGCCWNAQSNAGRRRREREKSVGETIKNFRAGTLVPMVHCYTHTVE